MKAFSFCLLLAFCITQVVGCTTVSRLPATGGTVQPGEETPALSQDYTITEADQDKTFVYPLTTRFSVELDAARHPRSQLFCEPTPIFGYISNGSNPDSSQYPVRYEITQVGECQLHSGDFKATIIAVDQ